MPHRFRLTALLLLWSDDRFFSPTDKTVLKPGTVTVVAAGTGELRLDGMPVPSSKPGPGAIKASIKPAPGEHELVLNGRKIRFFVGTAGAPDGWKEFRPHPPAAGCETCHAVTEGKWGFKQETCFRCHDQKPFPKTHQHNTEVLAECQLCHSPHGSPEKSHLKLAKEVACKQCHG